MTKRLAVLFVSLLTVALLCVYVKSRPIPLCAGDYCCCAPLDNNKVMSPECCCKEHKCCKNGCSPVDGVGCCPDGNCCCVDSAHCLKEEKK